MKAFLQLTTGLAAALLSLPVLAALNIFACEPEWAALAQVIGGDQVSTFSATTAFQDPHHIQARPSLIARVRSADLLVCTGSELEIGWLPLLLSQSGNARIQPGTPGYLEASQYVLRIEVPRVIDRSLGDIHAGGNPHIQTDPRNIDKVSAVLAVRLAQLDPSHAAMYKANEEAFEKRWRAAIARWEKEAAPLRGAPVVVHHKDYSYLIAWLGMREVGSLEPRPGIPPTTSHLAELVEAMKHNPARLIVYSSYNDPRASEFLSSRTGIPKVLLPFTVGGTDRAKDLFGYFDELIGRLRGALK
jgi:zinc/manganese transport system substrate-binding protein